MVSVPALAERYRWLVCVASVALALAVRLAFAPILGPVAPYMLFVLAVAVSAWVGGLLTGLVATGLSAASAGVLVVAAGANTLPGAVQALQLGFFLAVGLAISGLAEATQRARARTAAAELNARDEREQRLRDVEAERNQLAEVLRQAPSFMVTLRGPTHVYERENELHRKLIGHRDVIGKTVREALPEVVDQGFVAMLDRVYETGKPFVGSATPVMIVHTPGQPPEERILDFVYQPLRDPTGKVTGILAQGVDQTDRYRAQRELQKQQKLTQAVIDGSPALIYVKDREGKYLLVNRAWSELAGVQPDAARGTTDEAVFGPDVGRMVRTADQRVLETGRELTVEETAVVRGRRVTFLSYKFPLRDEAGAIFAVCGVSPDITELKEAEAAVRDAETRLRQLNEQLEQRVRDRTAELEAANRELEAFSYSVSHDLRAPLRGVDGFAKMLLEDYADKLDDRGRGWLDRVRAGAQRMGSLIDDLLRLSRVTRTELKREPIDLGAIAREVGDELRRHHPSREVELVITSPLPAVGDRHLLRIVFENLLGNAWKFTGKVERPRIEVGELMRDGKRSFFVRDNGAGFEMAYAQKLFAAFQRLHSTTEFEGTGIGLATVQRIVSRHGGQVWAEGAPNEGATFGFTL